MKLLIVFLLSFAFPEPEKIKETRQLYAEAVQSPEAADKLLLKLENVEADPLLIGYRAAAEALIAKHAVNPYTKLKMLKQSEVTFKKAIEGAPENIEIRFLRFTVQHYIPSWLGYSNDLNEDRKVIVKYLPVQLNRLDPDYRGVIIRFMKECGRCSNDEISSINKLDYK